jgi:hypothetical protein
VNMYRTMCIAPAPEFRVAQEGARDSGMALAKRLCGLQVDTI